MYSSTKTKELPIVGILQVNSYLHVIEVNDNSILLSAENLNSKNFFEKSKLYQIGNIPSELRKPGSAFMPVTIKEEIYFKPCRYSDNFKNVVVCKIKPIASV